MKNIVIGNIRVQLLCSDVVRIEYGKGGKFENRNTFFIPNRSDYAKNQVAYFKEDNAIRFGEYKLYIPKDAKSLNGVKLEKNGVRVYSYKKLDNSGELPPPDMTPDVFAISDSTRIIVPNGGYSVDRKGEYSIEENVQDVYLLLCGGDAKKLRKLYVELTGRCEMVRLSTFGGWNSKYYAYSEEDAKQLILDYEKHDVPLDVMVIDTDWRSCEGGWGYDINTKLFPDMKRFLDFAHSHGVEVMFNDHPEPVNGAQVFDPQEIAYRERNLQSLMDMGLDIWWYDRNWVTNLVSPTKNIRWETFGLYLYSDITRNYYRKVGVNSEIYRRPVVMGNVVNVANGYYQAITDSASHRYSIQWTGDIQSEADSLAREVSTLIKCGNNCVPYVNSDCGGHLGNPNKEGFIRWMQFGTLSPVFRPHCTNYVKRFREPWAYDGETLDIVREYNNLRYRLLPVIYKSAHDNYETGEPIFKSLFFEFPEDKKAAKLNNEYMLGSNILIRPVAGRNYVTVQKKNFVSPVKATYYDGRELQGEPIAKAEYDTLDMVLYHTSPEKGVPVYNFSARFETEVMFESDVELIVCSDDGATVYIDGEKVLEDKTMHSAMYFPLKVIKGGEPHKVEIEYFQAGGEAALVLSYCEAVADDKVRTYLPKGKWLDVFDGKIYCGEKTIVKKYELKQMPIFVRLGAIVPLCFEAHNTKEQKWNRLVLDYYPDKTSNDCGYIYEDDGETTAYKKGDYRTTAYSAEYDKERNAYVVRIHAALGAFDGDRCLLKREVTVKYHLLNPAETVKRITVNGQERGFVKTLQDGDAFPFGVKCGSPDGDVICTVVRTEVNKDHEILFYLG